ncbi:MAG: hypothetical protein KA154_14355, partial [Gemmatimonadaceae bacterium]|nr:hypothetical protein [Gemmatimonadaceae bacterium]
QFDKYWQQRTRRQYGALALVANLSLVGGIFGLLLGPLFWNRRRRDRRRLETMRAADEAQDRALRESALAALLAAMPAAVPAETDSTAMPDAEPAIPGEETPKVSAEPRLRDADS